MNDDFDDELPEAAPESPQPRLVCAAELPCQTPAWLWPGYVPLGKLTVLDGAPDTGKSLCAIDLAARVSADGVMPDGSVGISGPVILMTDESWGDTVRPRLAAAGANLARVHVLSTVHVGNNDQPLVLPRDVAGLRDVLLRTGAKLLVIDPFAAFVEGDMGRTLRRLTQLAQEAGCAMLLVRHLAKGRGRVPMLRGAGPLAIIATARAGLLLAADPAEPTKRVLAPFKNTLGPLAPALAFAIVGVPPLGGSAPAPPKGGTPTAKLAWSGSCDWTAEELLAGPDAARERTAFQDACELLTAAVKFGPVSVIAARREAGEIGVSDSTLRRAKAALGLRSERQGFGPHGSWVWYRPGDRAAESAPIPALPIAPPKPHPPKPKAKGGARPERLCEIPPENPALEQYPDDLKTECMNELIQDLVTALRTPGGAAAKR